MEINRSRIPKQKFAPECTKTSISFLKMSESGSWWMCLGVDAPAETGGEIAPGDTDRSFIDAFSSTWSTVAVFFFFDDKLEVSDFVSGHAAVELVMSLAVGKRTLFGSFNSMNFSSIFMMASSVI